MAVRLPASVVAQVDAHIATLRASSPWARVGRSEALRDLVVKGLESHSHPSTSAHAAIKRRAQDVQAHAAQRVLNSTQRAVVLHLLAHGNHPSTAKEVQAALALPKEPRFREWEDAGILLRAEERGRYVVAPDYTTVRETESTE